MCCVGGATCRKTLLSYRLSHTYTLTVLGWLFRRFTLLRHFSEWRVKGESRKQNKNTNNRIRDSSQQKKTVRARKTTENETETVK